MREHCKDFCQSAVVIHVGVINVQSVLCDRLLVRVNLQIVEFV